MNPSEKNPLSHVSPLAELIEAVIMDDTKKVQELLKSGVDPNAYEDIAKVRPLHFAAQYNALESALLLIKAGANIEAETTDGLTPLEIAKMNFHEDLMLALLTDENVTRH